MMKIYIFTQCLKNYKLGKKLDFFQKNATMTKK